MPPIPNKLILAGTDTSSSAAPPPVGSCAAGSGAAGPASLNIFGASAAAASAYRELLEIQIKH